MCDERSFVVLVVVDFRIQVSMIPIQTENVSVVLRSYKSIQMPVMDGFEATRRLRTLGYTDLPIYGLTASVARSDFSELGFNEWLPKPILMKELKSKLSKVKRRRINRSGSSTGS